MSKTGIKVKLIGTDGNAFALIGRVRKALKENGFAHFVEPFVEEAMSGDYNHLLTVIGDYVDIE